MFTSRWCRPRARPTVARGTPPSRRCRPSVERLEDRTLPTSYVFTRIIDDTGPLRNFANVPPSINGQGTAAFTATRHLDPEGRLGYFTSNGQSIATIAVDGQSIAGATLGLYHRTLAFNDAGTVAFFGYLNDTSRGGVFAGNGGPLAIIGPPPPPNDASTPRYMSAEDITNSGVVLMTHGLAAGSDLYLGQGGTPFPLYVSGSFSSGGLTVGVFGGGSVNDAGTAAFVAGREPGVYFGVFRGSGGAVTNIADTQSHGGFYISSFGSTSINNLGVVAFDAIPASPSGLAGVRGIYTGSGGPITTIATATGPFLELGPFGPSINDAGTVGFEARLTAGGIGLFTGPDPLTDKVIASGDMLFGSRVTSVRFGRFGLNNRGQFAFYASTENGRQGIYRADPVTTPVIVSSVAVNAGQVDTNQRSMVTSATVTFAGQINFAGPATNAFQLTRTGPGAPMGNVTLTVDLSGSTATQTIARLTFSGPLTEGPVGVPSLIDGNYMLTVFSVQVTGGIAGGDNLTALFRLYGDVNGDKAVNGLDLATLRTTFGTVAGNANYVSFLDLNGDGAINGLDLAAFRIRFGMALP
jgi:hypothetical protein